jgi:hypothetical protein
MLFSGCTAQWQGICHDLDSTPSTIKKWKKVEKKVGHGITQSVCNPRMAILCYWYPLLKRQEREREREDGFILKMYIENYKLSTYCRWPWIPLKQDSKVIIVSHLFLNYLQCLSRKEISSKAVILSWSYFILRGHWQCVETFRM